MRIIVNQIEYELPHQSVISDALSLIEAKPPFAVAVNMNFVPKTQYRSEEHTSELQSH